MQPKVDQTMKNEAFIKTVCCCGKHEIHVVSQFSKRGLPCNHYACVRGCCPHVNESPCPKEKIMGMPTDVLGVF